MTVRLGRWLAEFVLIVVGVLAALAVDDWRERRSERAFEQHLLEGIRRDLERDLADLGSGIGGAQTRMAGADELLLQIGDPDAGAVRIPPVEGPNALDLLSRTYDAHLAAARQRYPPNSLTAQQALLMASVS